MQAPLIDPALALSATRRLPDEYRWLLPQYPRDGWLRHPNMGAHTRFWLQIHSSFRRAGDELDEITRLHRENEIPTEAFRGAMAPRLQHFLGSLEHHHQMEDHVFFPRFTAAEPLVAKGIDLLEADHEAIDRAIHQTVRDANALLQASDGDAALKASENYARTSETLVAFMRKHLDDEEEIVMPLILDRGERALGVEG